MNVDFSTSGYRSGGTPLADDLPDPPRPRPAAGVRAALHWPHRSAPLPRGRRAGRGAEDLAGIASRRGVRQSPCPGAGHGGAHGGRPQRDGAGRSPGGVREPVGGADLRGDPPALARAVCGAGPASGQLRTAGGRELPGGRHTADERAAGYSPGNGGRRSRCQPQRGDLRTDMHTTAHGSRCADDPAPALRRRHHPAGERRQDGGCLRGRDARPGSIG